MLPLPYAVRSFWLEITRIVAVVPLAASKGASNFSRSKRAWSRPWRATREAWAAMSLASVRSRPRSLSRLEIMSWNSLAAANFSAWVPLKSFSSLDSRALNSWSLSCRVSAAARSNMPSSARASVLFRLIFSEEIICLACIAVLWSCEPKAIPSLEALSNKLCPALKSWSLSMSVNFWSLAISSITVCHSWELSWRSIWAARSRALFNALADKESSCKVAAWARLRELSAALKNLSAWAPFKSKLSAYCLCRFLNSWSESCLLSFPASVSKAARASAACASSWSINLAWRLAAAIPSVDAKLLPASVARDLRTKSCNLAALAKALPWSCNAAALSNTFWAACLTRR